MNEVEKPRRSLFVAGTLLIIVFVVIVFEIGSMIAIKFFIFSLDSPSFYQVPKTDELGFNRYMRIRDPELGWPAPETIGGDSYDSTGSRHIPLFPNPGGECVSLYGDSYTYGDEVLHHEAWSNVLSKLMGCRVANFGVGAYGTDQAFLRFRRNTKDSAKITILGILPHDMLRNVNQYTYFAGGIHNVYGLKPRFIVTDDELSLIPLPKYDYKNFLRAIRNPEVYFKHEVFLPDTAYGPSTMSFPYTVLFFKLLFSERIQYWLKGKPSWINFISEDHPSQSLKITSAIAKEFTRLAESRGMQSFVLIFPTAISFKNFMKNGEIATQSLVDKLEEFGIRYLDLHEPIQEYLGEKSYCSLLTNESGCAGHFNAEGNRMLAEIVYKYISDWDVK